MINRERIHNIEYISMAACFACVLIIALSREETSSSENSQLAGLIAIFAMSWFYAGGNVLSRKLKTVPNVKIVFWHGLIGTSTSLLFFSVYGLATTGYETSVAITNQDAELNGFILLLLCLLCDFICLNTQNIAY